MTFEPIEFRNGRTGGTPVNALNLNLLQARLAAALAAGGGDLTDVTVGPDNPTTLPPGSIHVRTEAGDGVAMKITPGSSGADVFVVSTKPTDLAPNQIAILWPAGAPVPTAMYIGQEA